VALAYEARNLYLHFVKEEALSAFSFSDIVTFAEERTLSQVIKQLGILLETYLPHNALSTIFSSNTYYHIRTIIGRNAKLV
jgi:hypothetical protein